MNYEQMIEAKRHSFGGLSKREKVRGRGSAFASKPEGVELGDGLLEYLRVAGVARTEPQLCRLFHDRS